MCHCVLSGITRPLWSSRSKGRDRHSGECWAFYFSLLLAAEKGPCTILFNKANECDVFYNVLHHIVCMHAKLPVTKTRGVHPFFTCCWTQITSWKDSRLSNVQWNEAQLTRTHNSKNSAPPLCFSLLRCWGKHPKIRATGRIHCGWSSFGESIFRALLNLEPCQRLPDYTTTAPSLLSRPF